MSRRNEFVFHLVIQSLRHSVIHAIVTHVEHGRERPIVQVRGVHKFFTRGSEQVDVLNDLSLDVPAGEFLALMGPSGSGKTTLLNLIAGLDRPSQGEVWVGGKLISGMSEAQLARWRTRHVGFIFQFYHLLPVLSAYENVELPLLLLPLSAAQRKRQVLTALELVGPERPLVSSPGATLRRPATARRHRPGDRDRSDADRGRRTDRRSGRQKRGEILDLLGELQQTLEKTIILVTHDPRAADRAHRELHLDKGQLVEQAAATKGSVPRGYSHRTQSARVISRRIENRRDAVSSL